MNQLINNFLQALAQTTRFNFLPEDTEGATPASSRWMHVLIRAMMGVVYFLIAALLSHIFRQPAAAVVLSTVTILALHHWLTAGRESHLPKLFQQAWLPSTIKTDTLDALSLFFQCLPALLLLALLCLHSAIWLPSILALGAAGGRELARKTTADLKLDWGCWLVALATIFLTIICPCLGSATLCSLATHSTLQILTITFLSIFCGRLLPRRPAGFLANSFFISMVVTLMVLLIECL
ncbi:MAG: hypothetical protein J5654_06825 [Victivallales bacterium]|nr:hypothetical protein [Victivallales bacterium]